VLASFTLLFAWLSYGTVNVNYALFSVFITGYIVFLLALAVVSGPVIAQRRALCNRIGRLDCSQSETGRNLPSAEPLEEGSG
jgi:hypothetical protein